MQTFQAWMNTLNGIVWGPAMLVLILGTGFYLQVRLGGMPIRRIGSGLRLVWRGRVGDVDGHGEVSPFAALMTCLAATIGVGNIAGVATAIALGGPGAVFWMWMTALVGMATKYAEVVLAVHFREKDADGRWVGGPMYAITQGPGRALGLARHRVRAVRRTGRLRHRQHGAVEQHRRGNAGLVRLEPDRDWNRAVRADAAVILGGIQRISAVANWLVPFMAVGYIVAALIVVIAHASEVPAAIVTIVTHAFTPTAATGGFAGAAVMAAIRYGVARGIFSNEAGLGTAGIAQSAGVTSNPVRSGLIGMMGTFFDTIVVCSMTGIAIVVSGVWTSGETGAVLTQLAFQTAMPGIGDEVVAIALAIFALTTIFGWSFYGERCWNYLLGPRSILPFRVLWTIAVFLGAITHLDLAWTIADTLNALMAVPNLVALLALAPVVVRLTREHLRAALDVR